MHFCVNPADGLLTFMLKFESPKAIPDQSPKAIGHPSDASRTGNHKKTSSMSNKMNA